jgi:hypothetical protein
VSRERQRRLYWQVAILAALGALVAGFCLLSALRADELDGPAATGGELTSQFEADNNLARSATDTNTTSSSGGCPWWDWWNCWCGCCCGDDVTFNPNPIITGYEWDPVANQIVPKKIWQVVTATFCPKALAGTAKIVVDDPNSRIEPIADGDLTRDVNAGTITFEVYGKSTTPANQPNGDVTIKATKADNTALKGEAKVVVVVPASQTRVVGPPFVRNDATALGGGFYQLTSTGGVGSNHYF